MNTGIVKVDISGQAYDLSTSMAEFKALADEIYLSGVDNPYIEPVNIPPYNSEDPSHLLITEANGNWNSTNLNSSTYKHFYVEPGDYSSSIINLTTDGTSVERRTISLYDGLETHPASLSVAEQADIKVSFDSASYWTLDRMSGLSYQPEVDVIWFENGSTNNIINRHHLKDFYYGIRILHLCHNTTIQNSYFDTMTYEGKVSDNVAISITTQNQGEGTLIKDCKFINNEFKNSLDCIHFVNPSDGSIEDVNYEGCIADSNKMWVTSDTYYDDLWSNGGQLDPNGMYAFCENAFDVKAGSDNPSNPLIISNNIAWGFRRSVEDNGIGGCITIMYGSDNVNLINNVFFDTERGIQINKEGIYPGNEFSATSWNIKNNIVWEANKVAPVNDVYANFVYEADQINVEDNTIVDCAGGFGIVFDDGSAPVGDYTWKNNLFIDSGTVQNNGGNVDAAANYYYGANTVNISGAGDVSGGASSNANMTDFTFNYDIFTSSPKSKTLTGVISTPSSPHYGAAGSDLT